VAGVVIDEQLGSWPTTSEFPRCIYRAAQIEATVDKDTRDTSEAARIADQGLVVEPSASE
jgi:hypothetical protein